METAAETWPLPSPPVSILAPPLAPHDSNPGGNYSSGPVSWVPLSDDSKFIHIQFSMDGIAHH